MLEAPYTLPPSSLNSCGVLGDCICLLGLCNKCKLGGLNKRNVVSYGSGGYMAKIGVLAALFPSESWEGNYVPRFSSRSGHVWQSLAFPGD